MIRSVLGNRASIGGVLGQGRGGAAAQWWLSGGVSAANAIAVYAPKGAASLAASYTNLANPGTYDASPGVAPTFDTATGWTFAASEWLDCGYTPTATGTVIIRVSNLANTCSLFGCEKTTGGTYLFIYRHVSAGIAYANVDNATSAYNTPTLAAGVFAVAGRNAYRNGTAETNGCSATTGTVNRTIAIGGRYASTGIVIEKVNGKIQAVAIYNTTLSAAQVAAISAAMAAL